MRRNGLMPYRAKPYTICTSVLRMRAAACVPLGALVATQVLLGAGAGAVPHFLGPRRTILIVLIADATPLWKTSATRCDVGVCVWGDPGTMGDMRRWALWWCTDGPYDAACMRAVDVAAGLNGQVVDLQSEGGELSGEHVDFVCVLSGDGKGMEATNKSPGKKCWNCDCDVNDCQLLRPISHCTPAVRWGAYIRTIPPDHRVGDYAHGGCRVANAFVKRVKADLEGAIGEVARAGDAD